MQQGDCTIETALDRLRARSREVDRADFLAGERVLVLFVTPSLGHEEGEDGKQNSRQSHKPSFSGAPRTRNSSAVRPKNHPLDRMPAESLSGSATPSLKNCRLRSRALSEKPGRHLTNTV